MKSCVFLLALSLVSIDCRAEDPLNINSFTTIPPIAMGDARYNTAVNQAIKAASIQSGLTKDIDMFTGFFTKQADKYSNYVLDTYSPVSKNKLFFVGGMAYTLGVAHQIKQTFVVIPGVTNTVLLAPDNARLDFGVSF
jgi:hypothetical protein